MSAPFDTFSFWSISTVLFSSPIKLTVKGILELLTSSNSITIIAEINIISLKSIFYY